jgi:hypothetical protein
MRKPFSFDRATNLLTVSAGGESYTQHLTGTYLGKPFQAADDGSGGPRRTASIP